MSNNLKEMLLKVKSGKFRDLIDKLDEENVTINYSDAVRIIVLCSNACFNLNVVDNIICEDLSLLVDKTLIFVSDLKDKLLDTYVQSIYFILKYFIQKNEYGIVVRKENMLLPNFLRYMEADKSKALYKNICILVHNLIVSLISKADAEIKSTYFTQFCMLACKMNAYIYPWSEVVSTKVNCYFRSCNSCNINIEEQCKNYEEIFKMYMLYAEKDCNLEDTFIGTLNYLKMIAHNILKKGHCAKMNHFIKTALCIFDKKFNGREYDFGMKILRDCNKMIVEFNDYPEESEMLSILSSLCVNLEKHSQKFGESLIFHEVSLFLNVIMKSKENCFEAIDKEVWNKKMTPALQIGFHRLISELFSYFAKHETVCVKFNGPCTNHENTASLSLGLVTASFIKVNITNGSDLPKKNTNLVFKQLQQCCEYILCLKANKCSNWKSNWRQIGSTLYNIGIKLYQKCSNSCSDYLLLFIRNLVKLEGLHESEIKDNILCSATELLCEVYLRANDLENALKFAAFAVYINKENREHNFKQWISVKVALKKCAAPSKLKELTLTRALKSCNETLDNILPTVDKKALVELLTFEIKQYKTIWPSKIPMLAVCKELYKRNEIEILAEILITIWDGNIKLELKIGDLIEDTINKLRTITSENKFKSTRPLLHLACLYFLNYIYKTEEIRNNMSDETNNETVPPKSPVNVGEAQSNPNDECDIVTTYDQLKMEEHAKTLKYLNLVVDYFEENLPSCTNPEIIEVLKKINAYTILIKVVIQYRLQCYSFQMLRACFLSLQIARLLGDKFKILQSIGIILEFSNLHAEGTKKLLSESEILISQLPDSPDKNKLLVTFYTNKSLLYLYYDDVNNSFGCFRLAKENFDKISCDPFDTVLEIRLEFLEAQLMMLPCDLEIPIHGFSLAKLHYLLNNAVDYYKNGGTGLTLFTLPIIFEISQAIADLYTMLRWPRELRCYTKLMTEISQEMVIPLRYCYALVSLVHADLLSMKCNDCQVKISGLSHILGVSRNNTFYQSTAEVKEAKHTLGTEEDLSNDFQELVLNIPSRQYQLSLGSPVLSQPLVLPSFIKHSKHCDCLHCMCIEYHELSIQKIALEAELCIYQKELADAQDYFDAAHHIYRCINERSKHFDEKIAKKLNMRVFRNVEDILRRTYCSLLLKYGNNFMRLKNNEAALKYNKILIENLKTTKFSNAYMYNEAYFQSVKLHLEQKPEISVCNVEEDATNNELRKTPETKQSSITFTKIMTPHTSPPKRIRKVLKFDLSDDEGATSVPTKSPTVKLHLPVSQNTIKTPASTSKIKIFTPATIQTTRSKRGLKSCNTNESDFLVPCSPEAYTPNSVKVYKELESGLKSKTKLLTDKLKIASVKKAKSVPVYVENEPDTRPTSSHTSVRKNLMSELNNINKAKKSTSKTSKKESSENGTKTVVKTRSHTVKRLT